MYSRCERLYITHCEQCRLPKTHSVQASQDAPGASSRRTPGHLLCSCVVMSLPVVYKLYYLRKCNVSVCIIMGRDYRRLNTHLLPHSKSFFSDPPLRLLSLLHRTVVNSLNWWRLNWSRTFNVIRRSRPAAYKLYNAVVITPCCHSVTGCRTDSSA